MRALSRLATTLLLVAAPAVAGAQSSATAAAPAAENQDKADKRDKGIPHHFDGITLTDDQKVKIRQLNHDFHTQINQVKVTSKKKDDVTGLTKPMTDATKKKLADLEEKELAAFRGALTPEQQAAFDKNIANEKADEAAAKAGKPAP